MINRLYRYDKSTTITLGKEVFPIERLVNVIKKTGVRGEFECDLKGGSELLEGTDLETELLHHLAMVLTNGGEWTYGRLDPAFLIDDEHLVTFPSVILISDRYPNSIFVVDALHPLAEKHFKLPKVIVQ